MLLLGISLLPIGMYQVPLSLDLLSVKGQSDVLRRVSVFRPYMLPLLYCLAL